MDPDLLEEAMRVTVGDAVRHLQHSGDTTSRAEGLARRARASRAYDPLGRADLVIEARAVLDEA